MKKNTISLVLLCVLLCFGQNSYGQYPNIENQMLSNSINSFMFYAFKDPIMFSDPKSLKDVNKRAKLSDDYHTQIENEKKQLMYRQYLQQQYFLRNYYNNPSRFIIPYP